MLVIAGLLTVAVLAGAFLFGELRRRKEMERRYERRRRGIAHSKAWEMVFGGLKQRRITHRRDDETG